MSTEDLHTSSHPTQSGKVVQLNGDCTSQITLPMSHTLTMWGRVGPAEGIVKLREREGQRVDLGRSFKGHL